MSDTTTSADWIAVDWGTSNLRAWAMTSAMSASNTAYASTRSADGMGRLARDQFEAALLNLVNPWLYSNKSGTDKITAIACGMVGARQGWIEAPYAKVPCPALPDGLTDGLLEAPVADPRIRVYIVPGICQDSPADVMRGEETQIAGFLRPNPDWEGVICLPGSHTKWVRIKVGQVVRFQTFMTGELFSTLASQTVLRHTIASKGWDEAAFLDALGDALNQPQHIAARLFSLRAEDLLNGLDGGCARARLSGILIGAELVAARTYWSTQPGQPEQAVAIIGTGTLAQLYARALATQSISANIADDQQMTLGGLITAYTRLNTP